jgi:hypothetical protein
MQIGEESIENLLINMLLENIHVNDKKYINLKDTFPCLFSLENELNIISV